MVLLVFLGFWWFLGVPNGRKLILGPWQSRSNLIFMDFGPKSLIFRFSWIFGIPKLPTFFEDFDPMWPLQRSYCLENVRILSLSILGFHQNLSKILIFISQSPPFYENPISSVRPSETQKGRFLCVHPHSGGGGGFSIIGFSSMSPPTGDGGGGEAETKFPPGSRPSPPLAPRDKISPWVWAVFFLLR